MVAVTNMSASGGKALAGYALYAAFNQRLYSVEPSVVALPALLPGLALNVQLFARCLSARPVSDPIRVFVLRVGKSMPVASSLVNMPLSEPALAAQA